MPTLGPIDFIVVRLPGTDFTSSVAEGLEALITANTIRVVDVLFVAKDHDGVVTVFELTDLDDRTYHGWDPLVDEVYGYLMEEDAMLLGDTLPRDSSAVLALIENTWAIQMVETIARVGGDVLVSERVPRPVVEEFVAHH